MALTDPCLFLQSDAHPARSFRAVITETWDEGVMGFGQMTVTERGAGANFSVDIASGRAVVQGDSATLQGNYMCTNDATVNVVISSAPSAGNERYDRVILEVKDNAEDAGGSNLPQFRVVAGTPATIVSGTAAAPALPNTAITLAIVGPIQNGTATITTSIITDGRSLAGRVSVPGTIESLAGTHVPNGWLNCDGTAVSRTTYADLFAEIGTAYGVGNGTTTFNLPNYQGKIPIAKLTGQSQVDTVGETGGEYTHTMTTGEMVAHDHGGVSGFMSNDHTHDVNPASVVVQGLSQNIAVGNTSVGGAGSYYGLSLGGGDTLTVDIPNTTSGTVSANHTHTVSSQGSTTAFNVMQPYQVCGLTVIRT